MFSLSPAQISHFQDHGYLVAENLFDPEKDFAPVISEYHGVLDSLANALYATGEIKSTYDELPFGERVINVYRDSGKVHAQYFDFSLPQANVKPDTPFWAGPAVFALIRNENLLDAVEALIGPEIYSNPVQHVRIKPPEHLTPRDEHGRPQLGKTPVHQDNGVVLPEADHTEMLTVWFPLGEATRENGCLAVWPGSHRGGLRDHCPAHGGLQIPGSQLPGKALPLPMKPGSALFMHRLTIHASLPNSSDHVRWSFDLRYNPIGQPTGRGAFPGFVARSHANPSAELRDPVAWHQLWLDARTSMAVGHSGAFNRWDPNSPACA